MPLARKRVADGPCSRLARAAAQLCASVLRRRSRPPRDRRRPLDRAASQPRGMCRSAVCSSAAAGAGHSCWPKPPRRDACGIAAGLEARRDALQLLGLVFQAARQPHRLRYINSGPGGLPQHTYVRRSSSLLPGGLDRAQRKLPLLRRNRHALENTVRCRTILVHLDDRPRRAEVLALALHARRTLRCASRRAVRARSDTHSIVSAREAGALVQEIEAHRPQKRRARRGEVSPTGAAPRKVEWRVSTAVVAGAAVGARYADLVVDQSEDPSGQALAAEQARRRPPGAVRAVPWPCMRQARARRLEREPRGGAP